MTYLCCTLGLPVFMLNNNFFNTFSLLPPDINRADIKLLTQDVVLSTNLVGRWQKPDDSFVTDDFLTFSIFHQSDEGLYKFYVTDWDGDETLAIQIYLAVNGSLFYYTLVSYPNIQEYELNSI